MYALESIDPPGNRRGCYFRPNSGFLGVEPWPQNVTENTGSVYHFFVNLSSDLAQFAASVADW